MTVIEYKSESDLIITRTDVMIRERVAFRVQINGPQSFEIQFPLLVKVAKAKDKFGKVPVELQGSRMKIMLNRNLKAGDVHAIQIKLLVELPRERIGSIDVLNWGSLNLREIQSSIPLFQVLGFGSHRIKNGTHKYSENFSDDITPNLARFRPTRIEMGNSQVVKISLKMIVDCRTGGRVQRISTFGPTSSKRQQVSLLSSGIEIEYDQNNNPRYILVSEIPPGQYRELVISWQVKINQGLENTTDLGSTNAMDIMLRQSSKFNEYLTESEFWPISNQKIRNLITKLPKKDTIFEMHRLLFEFTNRQLTYRITNNRQDAVTALTAGIGDCSEYADLLVTLHRAAHIPSRVVEGIILENEKVCNPEGHAWVEFLTKKGWMPCDPTWGITLGVTSQHIEFTHQKMGQESSVYGIQYQGPPPTVSYQICWDRI